LEMPFITKLEILTGQFPVILLKILHDFDLRA
jgi:hypothetical protein